MKFMLEYEWLITAAITLFFTLFTIFVFVYRLHLQHCARLDKIEKRTLRQTNALIEFIRISSPEALPAAQSLLKDEGGHY